MVLSRSVGDMLLVELPVRSRTLRQSLARDWIFACEIENLYTHA